MRQSVLVRPLAVFAWLLLVATLLGRAGRLHWSGDYFALLPDWYFGLGVVLLAAAIWLKLWRTVLVLAIVVAGNGWLLAPYWLGGAVTDDGDAADGDDGVPLIVVGDFNASPWSYTVTNLAQQAAVADAHLGRGLIKTWRRGPIILTLDHILVSDDVVVVDYQRGEVGGSDHKPLIVDLAIGR